MTKKRRFGLWRKLIVAAVLLAWLATIIWLVKPIATLNSLEQVDDYPLYTMHYYGSYEQALSTAEAIGRLMGAASSNSSQAEAQPMWACSLFAALGNADQQHYGRNFDWRFSPAVLLFTDPPDGYASVSMVDIAYLGFGRGEVDGLADRSLIERGALLNAPYLPFDGMNEHGLVVGMAAVPPGGMRPDSNKETIDSLRVMREMLDHARNVDEAVDIMGSYNIDMGGGPPIHYLIADASGHAALVEFYRSELHVIPNKTPWHLATNFLRSAAGDSPQGRCRRYDTIDERLTRAKGQITTQEAMDLLADVAQSDTQWSVVYEMSSGKVNVAMGRAYERMYTFGDE